MNPAERCNFFYYNNGITIICDSMEKVETGLFSGQMSRLLEGGALTWEAPTVMALYAAALSVLLALLFKKKGLA